MSVDRDKILEQALKHELRGDTAATPQCLDAERFAAWQDDALDAAQVAEIESHVSTCARCQSMLAAFARGTADTVNTSPSTATESRVSWWKWWMAPIAAGVAAVTIWMVVPEQQQVASRPPAVEPERRARAIESDVKDERSKANVASNERQQLRDQAVAAPKEAVALAQPSASPSPASPPPPAAPAALSAPAARTEAAGARADALQKTAQFAVAPLEVPTLDRNVRWRIAGNRIERTDDAGQTWTTKHERLGENIASGSAPSSSVGWFAGRAGIVILTTDAGATFVEVGLAEPLDIASISATDARTAVISTVGGRRFRTEDGGRTWLPVP